MSRRQNPLYVPSNLMGAPRPRLDRPAKQQVKYQQQKTQDNVQGEYNIWYHRYLGDDYDRKVEARTVRVSYKDDTGLTQGGPEAPICIHFARGICHKGHRCHFRHQIPTEDDELALSMLKDIFGRTRHGTDRDDMGGTGNFNRNNRTLYIGNIVSKKDERAIEKQVKADFAVFGQVEYVRIILTKAIAFCRFKLRSAAEFSLVAMEDQKTDYGDIVVKWANVDPNPLAKEFERRADEALAQYAIAKRIAEMSQKDRQAWEQMQDIENGVYPENTGVSTNPGLLEGPQGGGTGLLDGPGGASNPGLLPVPSNNNNNVDNNNNFNMINQQKQPEELFAEYWGSYYARDFFQKYGENIPPPGVNEIPPLEITDTLKKTMKNPFTGEVVTDNVVVNPFNQAVHPYAYRDYGWNRPKLSEAEREKRKRKKAARQRREDEGNPEEYDPNASYGPSSQKRSKHLGKGRNKGAVTDQEAQAMSNTEPLAF